MVFRLVSSPKAVLYRALSVTSQSTMRSRFNNIVTAWLVASVPWCCPTSNAFVVPTQPAFYRQSSLSSSPSGTIEDQVDYEVPDDAVVIIKPKAMKRLRELKTQQETDSLVLRMGVRNGGCSGLSYVMDFSTADEIREDDAVDEYPTDNVKCVVDAKSMLYLYGLELDYSEELIGGGFRFTNPNAEDSCGCGSSFSV